MNCHKIVLQSRGHINISCVYGFVDAVNIFFIYIIHQIYCIGLTVKYPACLLWNFTRVVLMKLLLIRKATSLVTFLFKFASLLTYKAKMVLKPNIFKYFWNFKDRICWHYLSKVWNMYTSINIITKIKYPTTGILNIHTATVH